MHTILSPKLNNKSLNIFVDIDTDDAINSAIVQIPSLIPRFLTYNEGSKQYVVMVEDVITHFINHLFTGYEVLNTFTFRITRNADLTIHEDGEDLLIEIERFLKNVKWFCCTLRSRQSYSVYRRFRMVNRHFRSG